MIRSHFNGYGEASLNFTVDLSLSRSFYCPFQLSQLQSGVMQVGYIVMREPSTGARTKLLRIKGAEVVGVYHPLIDEKLMRVLRRYDFLLKLLAAASSMDVLLY